jgi:hypothetical protein
MAAVPAFYRTQWTFTEDEALRRYLIANLPQHFHKRYPPSGFPVDVVRINKGLKCIFRSYHMYVRQGPYRAQHWNVRCDPDLAALVGSNILVLDDHESALDRLIFANIKQILSKEAVERLQLDLQFSLDFPPISDTRHSPPDLSYFRKHFTSGVQTSDNESPSLAHAIL